MLNDIYDPAVYQTPAFPVLSRESRSNTYFLDWSGKDSFLSDGQPFLDDPTLGDFESRVQEFRFTIQPDYLRHIRYCAVKATEEYQIIHQLPADFSGRCHAPAEGYAKTAFILLSECTGETESWRLMARSMLLYRFWIGQVRADFRPELSDVGVLQLFLENSSSDYREEIRAFVEYTQRRYEEQYVTPLKPVIVPVSRRSAWDFSRETVPYLRRFFEKMQLDRRRKRCKGTHGKE